MRGARLLRHEDGAAMVEFAIVLPLLLLLVFGIIDFGRALFTMNNLTAAVREGARWGSVQQSEPWLDPAKTDIQTRVSDYLLLLGGDPIAPADVGVDGGEDVVTVTITDYQFAPITPLVNMIGLETIPMSTQATFRWERAAVDPPAEEEEPPVT